MNISNIERSKCLKFLVVWLDENLCGSEYIKYTESKVAEIIRLLYKAKSYTDKHSLFSFYHSYMHSYINYGNIAWRSTIRKIPKKVYCQQIHVIRIVFTVNQSVYSKPYIPILLTVCNNTSKKNVIKRVKSLNSYNWYRRNFDFI